MILRKETLQMDYIQKAANFSIHFVMELNSDKIEYGEIKFFTTRT